MSDELIRYSARVVKLGRLTWIKVETVPSRHLVGYFRTVDDITDNGQPVDMAHVRVMPS